MAELKNWRIHYNWGEFIAYGIVYGMASYKWSEGAGVHTSPISSVEIDESGLHIQTRNTLYFLDKDFINVDQHDDSLNALAQEFFKDDPKLFLSKIHKWLRKAQEDFKKNQTLLGNDTVYLELIPSTDSFFYRALYKDEYGRTHIERAEYHAGDFQDSVILCKSGVRWFPGSRGITFYDRLYIEEPPKDKVGCIKNVGVKPMKVTFATDKEIILQPGELYKAE